MVVGTLSRKEGGREVDGRKRKGRGEKTEVPGAQRAVAVCATWWHQFLRFSVLSIVLVGRLGPVPEWIPSP